MAIFFSLTANVNLDISKLEQRKNAISLSFYDIYGKKLTNLKDNYIKISKLSKDTTNIFISAEDKRFYKHKGIDYIRIGGAILSNLKTKSLSQGGSSISQQLIKNTQLSNEKTLVRKLKELKLTKQLENKYSKKEILELYLNNIYFGNGCYGIENASNYYFNKSASKLSLSEAALLASTINAPSIYNIKTNYEKVNKRKNLILELAKKYGYISIDKYNTSKNEKIAIFGNKDINYNIIANYLKNFIDKNLNTDNTKIDYNNLKIITTLNHTLEKNIQKIIDNYEDKLQYSISSIVIENQSNNILAVNGNFDIFNKKIQPGSTIKPILVYAPAIESNMISPATKILDESINISGYCPENADKKYHGYVSVRESLKNSYNIPAVKILNEYGIDNAQKFANRFNIAFSNQDNNLAIALGGLFDGISLIDLANAYTVFANNGKYRDYKIIDNVIYYGKKIKIKNDNEKQIIKESTAYQINDILKDCAKDGTAKRLDNFNFDIASKTGTVGKNNSKNNVGAFNIAYTKNHTVLTYIYGDDMPSNINGSTYPTIITNEIIKLLYKNTSPESFNIPKNIKIITLDKESYDNNIITKTNQNSNTISEIFSEDNIPDYTENSLSNKLTIKNKKNEQPLLKIFVKKDCSYKIYRIENGKTETINSFSSDKSDFYNFVDKTAKNGAFYEYFIEICENNSKNIYYSNHIKIKNS